MKIRYRIVEMDGTTEGNVLLLVDDAGSIPVPAEYSRVRVGNREGLYEVVEGGTLYLYNSADVCSISVFVRRVEEQRQEEGEEDGEE